MQRLRFAVLPLLLAACAAPPSHPVAAPTPATATLLAKALDGEALFTVAGGLKPVSEGFFSYSITVAAPDLAPIVEARAALAVWRDDTLWADVHVFHEPHGGKRAARGYVAHRRALAELLRAQSAFFAPYGLGPDTHPAEVFAIVERMPKLDRHRGFGLLFGYPAHAIEFFVAAEVAQERGGPGPKRRFVQIPTFAAPTGRFVYAVAADAPELPADRDLAAAAAVRLARYRELRSIFDVAGATTLPQADAAALLQLAATLVAEFTPAAPVSATAPVLH